MQQKIASVAVAVALLASAMFWFSSTSASIANAATAANGEEAWEYCEFSTTARFADRKYRLEPPDGKVIEASSFSEMGKTLGIGEIDNTTSILNHLGKQNWELVTQNTVANEVTYHCWTFKRKVKK